MKRYIHFTFHFFFLSLFTFCIYIYFFLILALRDIPAIKRSVHGKRVSRWLIVGRLSFPSLCVDVLFLSLSHLCVSKILMSLAHVFVHGGVRQRRISLWNFRSPFIFPFSLTSTTWAYAAIISYSIVEPFYRFAQLVICGCWSKKNWSNEPSWHGNCVAQP